MVSMRTTGAPRCLRASGCTSRSSHRCSAAIMSQVTIGGGDSATCGLLPMLTSFIGAAVPHSAPSRMGCSGTATTCETLQQDGAAGLGLLDLLLRPGAAAAGLASALSGSTRGHCAGLTAGGDGATDCRLRPHAEGSRRFCANAPGAASTQHAAAAAKRLIHIEDLPLVSARGPGT